MYGNSTNLYEARERWIRTLLLLELVFSIQLVCTIRDKWMEMGNGLDQDIADLLDDSIRLLSLVQRVPQARVDSNDGLYVPEHLLDEVLSSSFWDGVRLLERLFPQLRSMAVSTTHNNTRHRCTHISEVLHVAHKITLSVDNLIDRFLPLLLRVRHARDDLRGHGVDPQSACFLSQHRQSV